MLGVVDGWVWGGGVMRKGSIWVNGKENNRIRGFWKIDIIIIKLFDWRRLENIRNYFVYIILCFR